MAPLLPGTFPSEVFCRPSAQTADAYLTPAAGLGLSVSGSAVASDVVHPTRGASTVAQPFVLTGQKTD